MSSTHAHAESRATAWADRSSRRSVLALAVATWSGMTALCGMAVNFTMRFAARVLRYALVVIGVVNRWAAAH